MKIRRAVRLLGAVLASLCLLFSVSCGANVKDKTVQIEDVTAIAVVGEPFSSRFATASANILRAENASDYTVSRLTSEQILSRTPDGSWSERNGSIKVETSGGKTVATVRINKGLEYYSGQAVRISDYILLMEQICQVAHDGYYKDYYKNPIEGLVAFRFKRAGLTLADIPDFDAQTGEKLASLTKESYEELLQKTSIGGLFDGNLSAKNYDGKTFREIIEENSDELPAGYFSSAAREELLRRLCSILSQRPQSEWITELLYKSVYSDLLSSFRSEMESYGENPGSISGLKKVDDYTCKVTFERVVDENEAIAMLNLPLIQQNGSKRVGAFNFKKSADGISGSMISYVNKKGLNLAVLTAGAEEAIDTAAVGQVQIVVFIDKPTDALIERAHAAGLTYEPVGGGYAVYDASAVDAEFVRSLAVFC